MAAVTTTGFTERKISDRAIGTPLPILLVLVLEPCPVLGLIRLPQDPDHSRPHQDPISAGVSIPVRAATTTTVAAQAPTGLDRGCFTAAPSGIATEYYAEKNIRSAATVNPITQMPKFVITIDLIIRPSLMNSLG
jgi:hypothetical protein